VTGSDTNHFGANPAPPLTTHSYAFGKQMKFSNNYLSK